MAINRILRMIAISKPHFEIRVAMKGCYVKKFHLKKCYFDRDRTRTCNPQIRSLVPYPLGHTVAYINKWIIF